MIGYIYSATNIINGKMYIGQTTKKLDVRIKEHIYFSKRNAISHFQKAIVKYGEDNFKWDILEKIESETKTELIFLLNKNEIEYISKYNTFYGYGYNLDIGGSGHVGYKHTKETKLKMSQSGKGRVISEDTKLKMSESGKIKIFSNEHRNNLSISMTERMSDPKQNPMSGRYGELALSSKLKEKDVLEIRELYKNKIFSYSELSGQYGVTKRNIAVIVKRLTWKHI